MIRCLIGLVVTSVLLSGCVSVQETRRICEEPAALAYVQEPVQLLRHVVLFRFTEETTAEEIREIEQAFCALPTKIDAVYGFEWGTDVSVEGLHKEFTHCFLVTFLSEEARAEYLPHPAHEEFVALAKPHFADVLVVDYWAN